MLSLRIIMSLFFAVIFLTETQAKSLRGIAANGTAKNYGLMVGVSHGLPGIELDVDSVIQMSTNTAYNFSNLKLMDAQGTTTRIAEELVQQSKLVDDAGTFFFYYSGHGSPGSIYVEDALMSVDEIREAIKTGRDGLPPLARLVLMFDSCYSGTLLDPFRRILELNFTDEKTATTRMADSIVESFTSDERSSTYWKSLFVFASSRADETSLAGENGSVFTVALRKAFDEVIANKETLGDWVAKTKTYTEGHHPVERFAPKTLAKEPML